MPRPLSDTRVLDLSTGPSAGIATMVLADFGADVVKVESPTGDRFRELAAAPMWLRGKRSVALDLKSQAGREALAPLVQSADVVVVSGPPSRMARWAFSADDVIAANPSVVHCSITPFGPRGPYAEYPGYEGIVAAKAGRATLFARQLQREGPGYPALQIASHATAFGAVQGICAALYCRDKTGAAQRVETSLLQSLLNYDLASLLIAQLSANSDEPVPDPLAAGGDMPTLNYHPVLSKDGRWIQCGNLLEHLFMSFLDSIDLLGELLADERFQESAALWSEEAIEVARDRILERMLEKTADEWMKIFHENGNVAAEPYFETHEAIHHPDLVKNGAILSLEDPVHGTIRQLGPPALLSETPGRVERPAPAVGQHTDEVLAEVRTRRTFESTQKLVQGRPLEGITVVEFATIIATPLATTMLADLGARVIKVESLAGDPYRALLPFGLLAVKTNAGKESICIDMKSEEGRAIAHDLIRQADVLVHNFRPGIPEKLGIAYEQAKALNSKLIWISALGYGPNGPSANRPVTHPVAGAAMGGATLQAGPALRRSYETLEEIREGARQIMRANEANPDPNTSCIVASATLLGLLARERHGIGQAIHADMLLANAYANADDFLDYDDKPTRFAVDDGLYGLGPTYRLYPAQEGWVFLAVTTDDEWKALCELEGCEPLRANSSFGDQAYRQMNPEQLETEIAHVLAKRPARDWEKRATANGVGIVEVCESDPGSFYFNDEHVASNGFVPVVEHAFFGNMKRWGPPVTVNGFQKAYGAGALAGDCTDKLLRELGRSADEIERLRASGVVGSESPGAMPGVEAET